MTVVERGKRMFKGLEPWQVAVCMGILMVTLIGALVAAWAFTKWNAR